MYHDSQLPDPSHLASKRMFLWHRQPVCCIRTCLHHNGSTVGTYWHLISLGTSTFIQFCNVCFQLSKTPRLSSEYLHTLGSSAPCIALCQATVTQRVCEHSRESDFTGGKNFAHSSPPPLLDPLNIFPLLDDRPAHRGNTLKRISLYSPESQFRSKPHVWGQ